MRLANIVDIAHQTAVELKVGVEVISAAVAGDRGQINCDLNEETAAVQSARTGFQKLLAKSIGQLGALPKASQKWQEVEFDEDAVIGFVEMFHQAVSLELSKKEFASQYANPIIYSEYLRASSTYFLKEIGYKAGEASRISNRVRGLLQSAFKLDAAPSDSDY